MTNWEQIDGDIDVRTYEKVIKGRITKGRFQAIKSYARKNTFRTGNCGHEFDCCGCLSSSRVEIAYKPNAIVLTRTLTYNY